MQSSVPVVLVASPEAQARLRQELPRETLGTFESVSAFLASERAEEGLVLLGPGVSADQAVALAEALAGSGERWIVVLVREEAGSGGQGPVGRPLSVGYAQPLSDLLSLAGPDGEGPVLELHSVLRFVSRTRHDINNPITSALAETQLLMMDLEEGEVRDSLEVIQRQIGRIRDLVAELISLRPPSRPSPTEAFRTDAGGPEASS